MEKSGRNYVEFLINDIILGWSPEKRVCFGI